MTYQAGRQFKSLCIVQVLSLLYYCIKEGVGMGNAQSDHTVSSATEEYGPHI